MKNVTTGIRRKEIAAQRETEEYGNFVEEEMHY